MAKKDKKIDIATIQAWKSESEALRSSYDDRWAKNINLVNGVFSEDEMTRSAVRKRSKIFFRKIWATTWRLLASLNQVFLKDPDSFKIDGRGPEDVRKAKILNFMVTYRRDLMMRKENLYIKFIWAFQNILNLGWCVGKFSWKYNPDTGVDGPSFVVYPCEQVYPDMSAETKDDMKYIIFENYMGHDEMEELGYENVEDAMPMSIPSNPLRTARYAGDPDPLQNPGENEYPSSGRYKEGEKDKHPAKYRVWEVFYKEEGEVKFCVTDGQGLFFKKPEVSKYGSRFPVVMGSCLTEAHKLIGEGFPEVLEGPQESYNANLNMRKDNVALALNRRHIVSRYGGVDLQSLVNSKPGGITLADDVNAVKELDFRDVTQSSYAEAGVDDSLMQEMSGVTPTLMGMGGAGKATVAQINQSEGSAKLDLYISMIGETFVKDFYAQLAYLIQKFETDEKVFRVANDKLREETQEYGGADVYDIDDFDADCTINVGLGATGKEAEIRQTMLAMDRAVMANQSMIALMQTGMVPPQGVRLFDTTRFMEEVLPKLGYKDVSNFFVNIPPPPPQEAPQGQEGGQSIGRAGQGIAGALQPQIGDNVMPEANAMQAGGFGGI